MKKIVFVCLALLLLGMTACVSIPMERTEASKTAEKALTAEPTAEPVATEEPTSIPTDTPAPTDTPTPVPTDTPAPTEIPAEVAVADAMEKLARVQSVHMDMELAMEVEMVVSVGEEKQRLPMDITMTGRTDMSREPYLVKAAISLSAIGENMDALLYGTREDDAVVLYSSTDGGATWTKTRQKGVEGFQLPQDPTESFGQLLDMGAADLMRVGTDVVDGKPVTVYAGKVEGKYLQEVLESTGAAEELTEAMNEDLPAEVLENLGDINYTVMVEEESGLPVRYSMDMTEAMKSLVETVLQQSLAGQDLEDMEIGLDVPSATLELTWSRFDSIDPVVIPEAVLKAPEA